MNFTEEEYKEYDEYCKQVRLYGKNYELFVRIEEMCLSGAVQYKDYDSRYKFILKKLDTNDDIYNLPIVLSKGR